MPKTKTLKSVRTRYLGGYTDILKHLAETLADLRELGVGKVYPAALIYGAFPCYNVDAHGNTDLVTHVMLDEDDNLVAVGRSGTEYPLGEDIDGQDNFILSHPLGLLDGVAATVDKIQSSILKVSNHTGSQLLKDLVDWIGPEGEFPFEHGFPSPSIHEGETVVSVSAKEVVSIRDDTRQAVRHPLDTIGTARLKRIIEAVNRYVAFCIAEA